MIIKSYSKINLTLKVNSKSKNGIHEIQTLYSWINLIDKISIVEIKKNKDKIKNPDLIYPKQLFIIPNKIY